VGRGRIQRYQFESHFERDGAAMSAEDEQRAGISLMPFSSSAWVAERGLTAFSRMSKPKNNLHRILFLRSPQES
jgi:hypothetical protein